MLKSAKYIFDNIIISDEVNSTKNYAKQAQVGVDMSVRNIYKVDSPGFVATDKTYVPRYVKMESRYLNYNGHEFTGWFLHPGTYICELNEGTQFGPNDTGYIIQRSSLNRSGVTLLACVFDPGFTTRENDTVNTVSVRIIVENQNGFYLEQNARVGQMIVFENESCELYNGQYNGGRTTSKLVDGE